MCVWLLRRSIWDLHLPRDNCTQLKEIRCSDASGRSPAAAGWCCFWPHPHSSTDYTAEAQLVGCRSVCLSGWTPPPKAPSPLIHHTTCSWQPHRRTAQLSCRKWGKKAWMLEHPVTSTCYHRFPSEDNAHIHSHTHPKECMQAKQRLQQTMGLTLTAFHFLLFISLWREKWALSLEPPEH